MFCVHETHGIHLWWNESGREITQRAVQKTKRKSKRKTGKYELVNAATQSVKTKRRQEKGEEEKQ
jgi:hypothetical protein